MKPVALISRGVCWLMVPAVLLMAGCSRVDKSQTGLFDKEPSIVWPAPPEQPRIGYQATITRPSDLGIRRSGLVRFGQWLTGSQKGNEMLIKPFGIALDEHGNLCVTDTGANCVYFYDRKARKARRYEKAGKTAFQSPVAVAKAGENIYVADTSLRSVFVLGVDGKLRQQITNRLERPSGLTVRGEELYVADALRHVTAVFDLQGQFLREFGARGADAGQFNFPTHLALLGETNLLVTDSMNCRVQVLEPGGKCLAQLGKAGDSPGYFSRPKGVAADSFGHVYVVDGMFDNIQVFDAAGKFLLNFGSPGVGPGELWLPNGIAISSQNEIFVADSYNRRVQVFRYIGPS